MSLKIALIGPTWSDDFGIFSAIAKERNSQPPLGILYLAAVAEKMGHKVRVIDSDMENFSLDSLIEYVLKENYDLVGISATSPIFHKAAALARGLKARSFKNPILIGGEHLNILKKDALSECFDFGFYGECDESFADFLSVYERGGKDYEKVKGLIFRKDNNIIENPPSPLIQNLDSLSFPSMHLIKHKNYFLPFAKRPALNYLPMRATRGCPFKCVFCSEPLTSPVIRYRSPGNIVDEMEKWSKELGVSHFLFMDSNLTLNMEHTKAICDELISRGLGITFEGWTRANLVNKEILQLLKKAGLLRMSYGIESGDPEILKIIKKEVSLEDMRAAFKMTDEAGIEVACSVMLGLPGETKAAVMRTVSFVRSIPEILYANFSIANPYPGTEMLEWAKKGKYGLKLFLKDYSDYSRYDRSPVGVNDLRPEDLVRLQKIGLLIIHFTPGRIIASIRMLGFWKLVPVFISFVKEAILSLFKQ